MTAFNKTTNQPINTVDLSKNPTSKLSELVIKGNNVDYGFYKFELFVNVTFNVSAMLSSNVVSSYVEVIPGGLAVYAVKNGVSNVLIGSNQEFILQPALYSYDLDDVITADKLSFVFYCQTIGQNFNSTLVMNFFSLLCVHFKIKKFLDLIKIIPSLKKRKIF
jgi:hypothetical protein